MKNTTRYALILAPLVLIACGKKEPEVVAPAPVAVVAPAPAPAPAAAAPAAVDPAQMTDEQRKQAEKQKALDYAVMEDKYMNDPRAQWAATASASSVFGGTDPAESNMAKQMIGQVDGSDWTNNSQSIGFDWVELGFAKPVNATEVRLVVPGGDGVEAINKVELQDTDGKWNVVWTGLSDTKEDRRGQRTWFVRTFEKTPYKVKAVKFTIANNVEPGYKKADAAQLVGD